MCLTGAFLNLGWHAEFVFFLWCSGCPYWILIDCRLVSTVCPSSWSDSLSTTLYTHPRYKHPPVKRFKTIFFIIIILKVEWQTGRKVIFIFPVSCRNFLFRSLQSSGWRVTRDFSTLKSRPCHQCTHRWAKAGCLQTNTATQWMSFWLTLSVCIHQHTHAYHKCPCCCSIRPEACPDSVAVHLFLSPSPLLLFLSLLPVLTNPAFSLPGQPPGAFLHPLPCTGGWSNIPCADQGGEDSREQAGAWAEAQHHSAVLVQSRGSGPLPPPSAR